MRYDSGTCSFRRKLAIRWTQHSGIRSSVIYRSSGFNKSRSFLDVKKTASICFREQPASATVSTKRSNWWDDECPAQNPYYSGTKISNGLDAPVLVAAPSVRKLTTWQTANSLPKGWGLYPVLGSSWPSSRCTISEESRQADNTHWTGRPRSKLPLSGSLRNTVQSWSFPEPRERREIDIKVILTAFGLCVWTIKRKTVPKLDVI